MQWKNWLKNQMNYKIKYRANNKANNRVAQRVSSTTIMVLLLAANASASAADSTPMVALTDGQMRFVQVVTAQPRDFAPSLTVVGNADFDQNKSVQVSAPYAGTITAIAVDVGQKVRRGQPLFTIDSPDLLQAESSLLSSEASLRLTRAALQRAQTLFAAQGMAEKDYQQAESDETVAEANEKAAERAVRIFGKSDADVQRIINQRKLDSHFVVVSPISGEVMTRNAALGTLVQPGGTPVPVAVSSIADKWLIANVPESEAPVIKVRERVEAMFDAFPDEVFHGRVDNVGQMLDPNTHRLTARVVLPDPQDRIMPQMMATVRIFTGKVAHSPSVPAESLVREGDGAITVWVTQDQHHFYRRVVKLGMEQDGVYQILSGLRAGEQLAGEGALFVSNAWAMGLK